MTEIQHEAASPTTDSTGPTGSAVEAADLADRYDRMTALAALLDATAAELRERCGLAAAVLNQPDLVESAAASPATHARAEEALRTADHGPHALAVRAGELDADALVLRATVHTYRWIDDLQALAYRTLGSIAGRAVGYLAPEVALGGSLVAAGLIETDALDRDGVAAFISELAGAHPELLDHVASGGGGLLDGLRMRSLLTSAALAGEHGAVVARGGLRALGAEPMPDGVAGALRDTGGALLEPEEPAARIDEAAEATAHDGAPHGIADLLAELDAAIVPVTIRPLGDDRYLCLLAGSLHGGAAALVGGDLDGFAARARTALADLGQHRPDARLLVAGAGGAGAVAARLATEDHDVRIEHVVTVASPSSMVPRIPDPVRVLALEDRADPVAALGSLMNVDAANRLTLVLDRADDGAAVDACTHPDVVAELDRLRASGYLARS